MRLEALDVLTYTEHDPDRAVTTMPFDGAVALRLLPGDCSLALAAVFVPDPGDDAATHRVPWLFVTHAEESGATAYATARLIARSVERAEDGRRIEARYDLGLRPARAGLHTLLVEVADGPQITSLEWSLRVTHAYRA
ncbi:MAG: hypothetical protein WC211_07340 [Dehalococcoidia bacterium]